MLNDLRTPLFLQEIGKIIFAKIAQENPGIRDHFKTKLRETNTVDLAEHSVFSIDSTDLTERIFEHWKFPRTMINYIRYSKGENAFASLELDSANKGGVILKIIKTLLPVYGAQYGQIEIEEARFLAKKAGLNEAILMTLIEQRMPKAQLPDSANETEIGEL